MTCAICGKPRTNSESDPHGIFGNHEYQEQKKDQPVGLQIFPHIEQRSEEWYDQRRGIVTASVLGKLITPKTVKPASNPDSRALLHLLVAERVTGWTEPTWISSDMQRGIDDEPIARAKYAEHYAPVEEAGFMVRDFGNFRIGFSPDGLVGDEGLIEIKCPRAKGHLTTIVSGHPPIEHMAQLQTGLLVSGRKWIDFVSFCGGMPMWVHRVKPQQKWFDAIIEAVTTFEENAKELSRVYTESVVGLHPTERTINFADVELKL
ncbi:lambda exonuclease family protein [Mycolicibacterium mageritense]|uniref:lambda exonuclease family protein n=1 Tax=Mycolicibacterium mageritense TaxID=53462 RepID=UPI001E654EA5|nr:lambda exonuclease family protein [Mycolicibacterium mageritense]GJJ22316.1 hypothetical protein MTY414_59890 [Mycolicibacterium mageritense]